MVDVAIVGTGHSKFGNRTDVNLQELAWEAVKQALEESNLVPEGYRYVRGRQCWWVEFRTSFRDSNRRVL